MIYSAKFSCNENFPLVTNNDELLHFIRENFNEFEITEDSPIMMRFTTECYKKTFVLESPLQMLRENVSMDVLTQRIAQLTARVQQLEAISTFFLAYDSSYQPIILPMNIKFLSFSFSHPIEVNNMRIGAGDNNLDKLLNLPCLEGLSLNIGNTNIQFNNKTFTGGEILAFVLRGYAGGNSLRSISIQNYPFENLHDSGLTAVRNLEEIMITSTILMNVSEYLRCFTRLRKLSVVCEKVKAFDKTKIEAECKRRKIQVTIS